MTVEGVSFLAPAKWTKAEASGEVRALRAGWRQVRQARQAA